MRVMSSWGWKEHFDSPVLWVVRVLAVRVVFVDSHGARRCNPSRMGFPTTRWTARSPVTASSTGRRSDFLGLLSQLGSMAGPVADFPPAG